MDEQLLQILENLSNRFGIVVDWTASNVLPYVQELMDRVVKFEVATSVMFLLVGVLLILSVKLWARLIKYLKKIEDESESFYSDTEVERVLSAIAAVFCVIIGLLTVLCQVYDLIQCCILPEAILLRYLSMIK